MYPLKFESIYYEKVWGGNGIQEYRENVPNGTIGESWDLACHRNSISIVKNGRYVGTSLENLIISLGELIVGRELNKYCFKLIDFPFLIKIINSSEDLSLQVHPDDNYARQFEDDNGKLEAWYIISCEEEAEIVLGVKDCSKEELKSGCINGNVDKFLNKIKVSPRDLYLIEPGLIHSIGGGILLAEFQQNSDITYRVYDYGRGRELHIDKAFKVIDIDKVSNKLIITDEKKINDIITGKKFNITIYNVDGNVYEKSNINKFEIYTCVEGEGKILYIDEGVNKQEEIRALDTVLIPAALGEYIISGKMRLVKVFT